MRHWEYCCSPEGRRYEIDALRKKVAHNCLYQNLDALIKKELVEKGQVDQQANYYVLPDSERREIDARREWEKQYVAVPVADQTPSGTVTADE